MRKFIHFLENAFERVLFTTRWLQAPIYAGLIIGALVYAGRFFIEVVELCMHFSVLDETTVMLAALSLVDITMVFNLLIVVAIGGYYTFVSRIDGLDDHKDKPEWLSKISSSALKLKLIVSLVTISGVHLLKTFININNVSQQTAITQIAIHLTFVISALLLTLADKIEHSKH